MYAAVWLLYRDGAKIKPQHPPLVGQVISCRTRERAALYLWDVDWVHNTTHVREPLRILWNPSILRIGRADMLLAGLEATSGDRGRWFAQKWLCELLTADLAKHYFDWDRHKHAPTPPVAPAGPTGA